jgi:hypothetical protein
MKRTINYIKYLIILSGFGIAIPICAMQKPINLSGKEGKIAAENANGQQASSSKSNKKRKFDEFEADSNDKSLKSCFKKQKSEKPKQVQFSDQNQVIEIEKETPQEKIFTLYERLKYLQDKTGSNAREKLISINQNIAMCSKIYLNLLKIDASDMAHKISNLIPQAALDHIKAKEENELQPIAVAAAELSMNQVVNLTLQLVGQLKVNVDQANLLDELNQILHNDQLFASPSENSQEIPVKDHLNVIKNCIDAIAEIPQELAQKLTEEERAPLQLIIQYYQQRLELYSNAQTTDNQVELAQATSQITDLKNKTIKYIKLIVAKLIKK